MDCIFCKIITGELPSSKVYEDVGTFAFLDIHPIQKGHTLLIPKAHTETYLETSDAILANMAPIAKKIAAAMVVATDADGCTISINNGAAAGQDVFHIHWHLIPRFVGDALNRWPHGAYAEGEHEEYAKKIHAALKV